MQAALAAKAARIQAMGPLGEHLAGYGEDDDDENGDGPHGTDRTRPDATEPAPPWTRLLDAKTNHPYFWNRATGATVWTLAETHTDVPRTEACPKNGEGGKQEKQEHTTPGSERFEEPDARTPNTTDDADDAPETRKKRVSGAKGKKAESARRVWRDGDRNGNGRNGARNVFEKTREDARRRGDTFGAFGVASRDDASRARRRARHDRGLGASAVARSRGRTRRRAGVGSGAREDGERRRDDESRDGASGASSATRDGVPAALTGLAAAVAAAAARRHRQAAGAERDSRRAERLYFTKKKTNDGDGPDPFGEKNNRSLPPRTRVRRARLEATPRGGGAVRAARTAYEEEAEGADADPAKQATRREAEVARWRERAARGEARDVAGNANLAPVAGTGANARRRRQASARAAAGGGGC